MRLNFLRLALLGLVAGACATPGTPAASHRSAAGQDATLQIFLLAGQSNMAGRGRVEARDSVVEPHSTHSRGSGPEWAQ